MNFDIVIKNGKIVDGAGNPWFSADIGIKHEKIVKLGRIDNGHKVIDARGLVVCPGFIDAHSHADWKVHLKPKMESKIRQGITTAVVGQCGITFAPAKEPNIEFLVKYLSAWVPFDQQPKISWRTFHEYLEKQDQLSHVCNLAYLVGHGAIRIAAMGMDNRDPTSTELNLMKELVADAMTAGAFGLSTGLIYPPGVYSKTSELIELAQVVAKYGGVYYSHIRGEYDTVLQAVNEAIEIGEKGQLPVHISHLKAGGRNNWGRSVEILAAMEAARRRDVDVTYDQYPYSAGSTSLVTLLPPWAHEGGLKKLLERLKDPETEKRIRYDIEQGIPGWENTAKGVGWENVVVSSVKTDQNKDVEGKNLTEIAQLKQKPDEFSALRDLLLEEDGTAQMIMFAMNDDDIHRIMKHPLQMVGTDSGVVYPHGKGKPHPRGFGTFPRILARYVRDKNILTLEQAIKKMTSLPAQRLGLQDRGLIRPGKASDLIIFDPNSIQDTATFEDPHQYPIGIKYILVNGKVVVEENQQTTALPGKVLRHSS